MKDFNKLESDEEKWKWVIANQDKGITVMLDNDDTFIQTEDEDDDLGQFDDYIGNSFGVVSLLTALGVKCDGV